MLRDKVWNIPRNGEPAVPDRPRGFPSSLSIERIDELRSNLPPEVFANWLRSVWLIWTTGCQR
jgi:hypothetical protein